MTRPPLCARVRGAAALLILGMGMVAAPVRAEDRDASPVAAPAVDRTALVADAARRFGLPEAWVWAVIHAESRGNPHARSAAGAIGLMQIMPGTWTGLTARYGLGADPYDVRANILAGAAYLREMIDRYGDLPTALAAYNAGPGRVDAWRSGVRPLPVATPVYVDEIVTALGGSAPSPNASGPVAPVVTWRTAAIFIVRGDSAAGGSANPPAAPPIGASAAAISAPSAPRPAVANPLFIALSDRRAQ